MPAAQRSADVIVVGAGPGGATAAYWLAEAGADVVLLEKTAFPRDKVCGDGLTPRAVKQLLDMGIDLSDEVGWRRNKGLRLLQGGKTLHVPWPALSDMPGFGLVRTRMDFDEILARHSEKAGVRLYEQTNVTAPIRDGDQVVGVVAKDAAGEKVEFRAPIVLAADGNSSRLSIALGLRKREDRPLGVAVRTYFTSPRHDDDWMESWLELWDTSGPKPSLLPGYGWIFGVGDGTSNVGLGILNTSPAFGQIDYRKLLSQWLESTPPEWGFTPDNQVGEVRGSALPMAFNRTPHYRDGVLLVGDAGGMVNPFNGEGIAYAMESGRVAAELAATAYRQPATLREQLLAKYPQLIADQYGGYYTVGRAFVKLIGDPRLLKVGTKLALSTPGLRHFTLKLLANLTERNGRKDLSDRVINAMTAVAPR